MVTNSRRAIHISGGTNNCNGKHNRWKTDDSYQINIIKPLQLSSNNRHVRYCGDCCAIMFICWRFYDEMWFDLVELQSRYPHTPLKMASSVCPVVWTFSHIFSNIFLQVSCVCMHKILATMVTKVIIHKLNISSITGRWKVFSERFIILNQIGPNHWGEQYNTCFGKYQSPIDINSLAVKYAQLPALKFSGFDGFTNRTRLQNNGHTGESIGRASSNCEKRS